MPEPLLPPPLAGLLETSTVAAFELSERGVRDNGFHEHSHGQLLGSSRGLMTVSCEQGSWAVPATHGMWIPPNHLHAGRSHGPFVGWSIYVAERACSDLSGAPRMVPISGLLRETVHRMASWGTEPHEPARERLARVMIDEIESLPEDPLGLAMPSDPRLLRIARGLLEDLADSRRLEVWARWAGVATRTLSRRFVVETGFTFTAWRQRARLLRSLELLAQGESVTEIALELGYDNVSAFIALFRRTFGVTPTVYVRRHLERR